jgi:hypothetical protein
MGVSIQEEMPMTLAKDRVDMAAVEEGPPIVETVAEAVVTSAVVLEDVMAEEILVAAVAVARAT